MQRRVITWIEFGIAAVCLAAALWPFSGLCTGRPFWHDCEGWFIFSANLFGPLGVIALASAVWSLLTPSRTPHFVFAAASIGILGRIAYYALR